MRALRLPFLLSPLLAGVACYSILGPELTLPPDAVETEPPAEYALWYAEVEACLDLEGDFERVRWFEVPYNRWWDPVWEQYAIGTWRAPHDIYIAQGHLDDESVVKHEMVHDVLQGGETGDPRFYRCSGVEHRAA